MGWSRDAVWEAYDALDAAFDTVLDLDVAALSSAEKVALQARMERNLRRAPAAGQQLTAALIAETEPHLLGAKSWTEVLSTALRISTTAADVRLERAGRWARATRSPGRCWRRCGRPPPNAPGCSVTSMSR